MSITDIGKSNRTKKDKILTVSVAAYNVENYLERALESLADKDYVDALEVFVIDDGGQDRSLEIARAYEEKYPDTFHAVHKENGGYGSTVNYSISQAAGRYFKLLDGDDWMDVDGMKKIIRDLKDCDRDIVITNYYSVYDDVTYKMSTDGKSTAETIKTKEYTADKPHGMWALFYKTEMLKNCHLRLPEHSFYTDVIYSTIPFAIAETIQFYDYPVYCYRIGREEQSTSKESKIKHVKEWLKVTEIVYRFFDVHGQDHPYLLTRMIRYYALTIKLFLLFPPGSRQRKRLIRYEQRTKERHPVIYENAVKSKNMGRFISAMRKTGYKAYWIRGLIPDKYLI